jgi:hypothetical protein
MHPQLSHRLLLLASLVTISLIVNFAAQRNAAHEVDLSSEAAHVSSALTHGRGFSDPFGTGPSGPTAQMAPLFPYIHALICEVFGVGLWGWMAMVALTSVTWALVWIFAVRIAEFYGHRLAGIAAAFIGVLWPLPGRLFKWEAVFTAAALVCGAWLLARILAGQTARSVLLRFATALAVGVLLTPSTVVIWPCWALLIFVRLGWKRAIRATAFVIITALIPISLWTARNLLVFHHLIFVRDNLGLELALSNNDCAEPLLSRNVALGCFAAEHPSDSRAILQRVISFGEYEFFASEMHRGKEWIRAHPIRFLGLTLERAVLFWFPLDPATRASLLYGILFSVSSLLSVLALAWARSDGFWILLSALLPYSAVYCVIQIDERYRYPVLWASVLLACIGVSCCFRLLTARRAAPERFSVAGTPTMRRWH